MDHPSFGLRNKCIAPYTQECPNGTLSREKVSFGAQKMQQICDLMDEQVDEIYDIMDLDVEQVTDMIFTMFDKYESF